MTEESFKKLIEFLKENYDEKNENFYIIKDPFKHFREYLKFEIVEKDIEEGALFYDIIEDKNKLLATGYLTYFGSSFYNKNKNRIYNKTLTPFGELLNTYGFIEDICKNGIYYQFILEKIIKNKYYYRISPMLNKKIER